MALTSKNPVRVPQGRGSLWTLETKRQTNEHQDNQSFRFACSTRHFGRIVVRHQLVWVGATRVLAAARFGRGGGTTPPDAVLTIDASWAAYAFRGPAT